MHTWPHFLLRKCNGPAGGTLGEDPETGETISMEAGPFGMYIKAVKDGVKTRSTPLAKLQPEEVNLRVALDLLSYPKALGRHPESDEIVELRRASSTGKIRVGCGADCAYLPKVSLSAHLIVAVPDLLLAGLTDQPKWSNAKRTTRNCATCGNLVHSAFENFGGCQGSNCHCR